MSGKSLIIGMVLIVFLFSGGLVLPRMAYAIADWPAGDGAQAFNNDDLVAGVAEGEMDPVIKTYPACWDELTQCYGDSDNSGDVEDSDFLALKDSWYKCYGDLDYNPCADFDRDGCVKGFDFLTLKSNWYKNVPANCTPGDPCEIYLVWVFIDDTGVSGHEGFTGYMSKYETTNAQYCEFLNAALASGDITVSNKRVYVYGANGSNGGADFVGKLYFDTYSADSDSQITYSGGRFNVRSRDGDDMSNHPVVAVSWYGAAAFCNYYGYRLPTEWEWQAVADYDGSFTYGCGTSIDHSKANYDNDNPLSLSDWPYTTPVDYYPCYGYGMCDMAGNVWEWTSSCSVPPDYRVPLGGGWYGSADSCRVAGRHIIIRPDIRGSDLGFRVVLDLE